MAFSVYCQVVGTPETAGFVPCDTDPLKNYWARRFAVDAFIAEHALTPDERIRVEPAHNVDEVWIVRTRLVGARVLRFGEREKAT